MLRKEVSLRKAKITDSDFIYSLQTKKNRKYFRDSRMPSIGGHHVWFKEVLKSKSTQMYILIFSDQKVGLLRLDELNDGCVELSIIVSSDFVRRGIASQAIKLSENKMKGRFLKAVIHKKNVSSKKVFERLGFVVFQYDGDFVEYLKNA